MQFQTILTGASCWRRRFPSLLFMCLLLASCGGGSKKLGTTDFHSNTARQLESKVSRIDTRTGTFNINANIDDVWYAGKLTQYEQRGLMLGAHRTWIELRPKLSKETRPLSLFDLENEISVYVYANQYDNSLRFSEEVLSDKIMQIRLAENILNDPNQDVYIVLSIPGADTISIPQKGPARLGDRNVKLKNENTFCINCDLNRGL